MSQSLNPRVLIVEEAGQVLESHILAALSPSIQHLIQIGDPEQLRCIANVHELSVDNASSNGSHAAEWRYNESSMERLSRLGLKMKQLRVQRRMTPQVSALIRQVLKFELRRVHTLWRIS
jgi:superfamily I DNA and/or RNA helicase